MKTLDCFVLEDEEDWLGIHKSTIETARTIVKFDSRGRRKIGETRIPITITHSASYDQGVQRTARRTFDAYLVDGRFPWHYGEEQKHLLGVEFAKYLLSQGVSRDSIFFVSSQHSMLEGAVRAGLPNVFMKTHVANSETLGPSVKSYAELPAVLKNYFTQKASAYLTSSRTIKSA